MTHRSIKEAVQLLSEAVDPNSWGEAATITLPDIAFQRLLDESLPAAPYRGPSDDLRNTLRMVGPSGSYTVIHRGLR